jgi:hypothetical protein
MHRVSEDVRSTHSSEGGTVLDIRRGQMFRVNRVGARILELLNSGHQESEIAGEIAAEFVVSQEVANADVREFLGLLQSHRIIL